jgi:hypothetical protein
MIQNKESVPHILTFSSIYNSIKNMEHMERYKITENVKNVSYKKQCYRSISGPPEYEEVALTTHYTLSNEVIGHK